MISGLSRVEGVKGFLMRKALEGTKPGKKTNKQNNQSPPRDSEGCERNDASSSKEASKEALERPGWLAGYDRRILAAIRVATGRDDDVRTCDVTTRRRRLDVRPSASRAARRIPRSPPTPHALRMRCAAEAP